MHTPSWNSLKSHPVPSWLVQAKFSIYTHCDIYSMLVCCPNADRFPNAMYRPGTSQYEHDTGPYGGSEKFVYKELVAMFTGEKCNHGD